MEIRKNTVPAENQLPVTEEVSFELCGEAKRKIAFMGNSITRHGPAAELGWYGDWGMAASAKELDYVHRVLEGMARRGLAAGACICNGAGWERNYRENFSVNRYEQVRQFEPDYLILRLVENCPLEEFSRKAFEISYETLVDYLKSEHTKVILTTGFWKHPGDEVIQRIAERRGYPCVYLGELGEREDMKAAKRFSHSGVAAHPGDRGMDWIAGKLLEQIDEMEDGKEEFV